MKPRTACTRRRPSSPTCWSDDGRDEQSRLGEFRAADEDRPAAEDHRSHHPPIRAKPDRTRRGAGDRSEERRVGKEGRAWGMRYNEKKEKRRYERKTAKR